MFYVLDDNNNKYEGADIQEILAILNQAIEQGTLENITKDSAFVTKVKCCVGGATHHIAFITAAKYNELAAGNQLIADCYYIITDDTTCDDIDKALEELDTTTKNHTKALQNLQRTVEEGFRSMETGLLSGSIIPLKTQQIQVNLLATPAYTFDDTTYTLSTNALKNGAILILEIKEANAGTPYYAREAIYIYGADDTTYIKAIRIYENQLQFRYKYYGGNLTIHCVAKTTGKTYILNTIKYIKLGV